MNNRKLLTGLLVATLLSGGVCAFPQSKRCYSLEEIFSVAESGSSRLRTSLSNEDLSDKEISVAKSALLPDISVGLSLNFLGNGFTTKRDFSDGRKAAIPHLGNGLSVNISQPVFTGGAIKNNIELSKLKSTAARYSTDFMRDNIRFSLTGFYLDLYKCTNLRDVVCENIALAKKVLEEMHAKFEQGTVLLNDITRYELLVSNLELHLVKIDNTLDILNRNLVVTAGLPENTIVIPDSTLLARSLPAYDESWWQNEATANSPTLKLAKSEVKISEKAQDIVKSERLPKIGLEARWTIDGPILVEVPPINRNLSYWFIGVGVNYNLSSLYKSNRSLAKSKASTRVATDRLQTALEDLSLGIRTDYVKYLEANEEMKTQLKSVELAERNYRTTSTRYSAGMALITDMLDAANSLLESQENLVNARIEIIYYYYKLLFTSGKI